MSDRTPKNQSLGEYHYDETAFLPLQHGHQPVEARFEDEITLAIDCIAIEDEYGNTRHSGRTGLAALQQALGVCLARAGRKIEHYLSLGCEHGRLEG